MRSPFLALGALLVLAAACTPARAPWTSPGVAQDEADADWSDCRRVAERTVGPARREADMGRAAASSNPLEEADRRAAAQSVRRSVEACMRAKGYFPISSR